PLPGVGLSRWVAPARVARLCWLPILESRRGQPPSALIRPGTHPVLGGPETPTIRRIARATRGRRVSRRGRDGRRRGIFRGNAAWLAAQLKSPAERESSFAPYICRLRTTARSRWTRRTWALPSRNTGATTTTNFGC